MGMSVDEIILKEKEIAEEFKRTIDTHMVSEDMSLEEMYCDDTEVIEKALERRKELLDYHNTIANTMRKYQQIEQILDDCDLEAWEILEKVKEVVEDEIS